MVVDGGEAVVNKKRSRQEIMHGSEMNKTINPEEVKNKKRCESSNHEEHIWIEKQRRMKMKNMFTSLHALLPHLPPRPDKSTIVNEAVNHIKRLQQTLEKLEKQKQERLKSVSPLECKSSLINSQWHSYPYESSDGTFVTDPQRSFNSNNNNLSETMTISSSAPQLPVAFQTWCTPNLVLNICGDEAQLCIYATKKPSLLTTIVFLLDIHNIEVISANVLCKGNGNASCMIQAHLKRGSHQIQNTSSTDETYVQAAEEIARWVA